MEVCNCSMFCCTLPYVHSSIAIILMGKIELVALLNLSSWCLVMVERLFLAVRRGCLRFVIMVFPDHTHLLFFIIQNLPICMVKKMVVRSLMISLYNSCLVFNFYLFIYLFILFIYLFVYLFIFDKA